MANPQLDPPSSFSTSSSQHHESNNQPNQRLFLDQPFFGYMVQLTPVLFFTNNANDSEQNLRQLSINSPAYYNPNMIYPVYNLPVVAMPENFRIPHMTASSYHNYSQENLEVEQMGIDDRSVLDMEDSYSEETEAFPEQVYYEISNPDEVDGESPGISTTASLTLFGVHIPVPVQQQANRSAMQVPESNHSSAVHYPEVNSSVVHYPEEEMAMIMGTVVLDSMSNGFDSDYDDPTLDEYDLEPEEQMGQVDSGLSEETIMKHIQIKYHLPTTTLSLNEERDICVICQSEFEYREFIGGLHCGHKYHEQCIKKWLQQMNNCPICKATAVPHEHV